MGDDAGDVALEELQVAVEEGVAHPCDAEDGYHGIHACREDVAIDSCLHVGLAYEQYQGRYRHHHDLNGLRHREGLHHAIHLERRAQSGNAAEQYDQRYTQQECQHAPLRPGIQSRLRLCLHLVHRLDQTLSHATLVLRIVFQLLADAILHEGSHDDGYQRRGDGDEQHVVQPDALSAQQLRRDDRSRSCRHRTARDAQRGRDGGHRHRALRAYLRVLRDLGDDGQQRVGGVGGASQHGEEPRHERTQVGDLFGVLAQELRCLFHHVVQSAAEAVITEAMMSITSMGILPGRMPKTNTRINTPTMP